ncbi:MAG: hypothetical protein IKH21_05435 [Clostridia bacterium]|nr:hypothetical protein [Clostridia bacterium]
MKTDIAKTKNLQINLSKVKSKSYNQYRAKNGINIALDADYRTYSPKSQELFLKWVKIFLKTNPR